MKTKILLPLTCALAFCSAASAQEGFSSAVIVQAHGSMMGGDFFVSNFSANDIAMKKKFTPGFEAGLSFGYYFNDYLGLCLAGFYSRQGQTYADYREQSIDLIHTFKREVTLNYLKFPVSIALNTAPSDDISFSAFAGFYYALLLNYTDKSTIQYSATQGTLFDGTATVTGQDYKWEFTDHGAHFSERYHITGKPYKDDYGLTLGAGIEIKLGDAVYLPVMLNYQYGLADIKNHAAIEERGYETKYFWSEGSDRNLGEKSNSSSYGLLLGLRAVIE